MSVESLLDVWNEEGFNSLFKEVYNYIEFLCFFYWSLEKVVFEG